MKLDDFEENEVYRCTNNLKLLGLVFVKIGKRILRKNVAKDTNIWREYIPQKESRNTLEFTAVDPSTNNKEPIMATKAPAKKVVTKKPAAKKTATKKPAAKKTSSK
jgi:hypothetical protein